MALNFFAWRSLKARVTLLTLLLFVIGIWSLAFFASSLLRQDMQQMLGEQQFSDVTGIAHEIDDRLSDRKQALQTIAAEVTPAMMGNAAALQTLLEERPLLQLLFNGGVFITAGDGTVIANVPLSPGRIGANNIDREAVSVALKEGKTVIGRPIMGKKLEAPIFSITAPILDRNGKVLGVMVASINLGQPNFLDRIAQTHYGKTGDYLLIARQHKLIVTSTDKSRIMQPAPTPGLNAMHDRYMQGFEGFGVDVSTRGVQELSAAKSIPSADWFVAATLPTDEAFAPIIGMQRHLMLGAVVLTLLTGALTWWLMSRLLQRQLAPMLSASRALSNQATSDQPAQALPVQRQDEIGELIGSFNQLLETLAHRENALKKSEQNLTITLNSIGDGVIATDPQGLVTRMNPTAERLCGWTQDNALGRPLAHVFRIVNADTRESVADPAQLVMMHGQIVGLANHTVLVAKGGEEYQIADSAAPIRDANGQIVGVVLVFSDITEKYRIELALKNSEHQHRWLLENLSCGVVVHRADTSIMLSNAMAARLLGLTEDQMLGKTATDRGWYFLRDDGTPMTLDDYPVNRVMLSEAPLQNYVVGVCHAAHPQPTWLIGNAFPMRDEGSKILQVVVTFTEITQLKQAEKALQRSQTMMERTESMAHLASFEWDVDTDAVAWSPEMFRIFGRDPALGTPNLQGLTELYTPESAQQLFDAVALAVSNGIPYELELMTVQPDGEQRPSFVKGFPERDGSNRVIRLAGLVQDITQRKREEEKTRLAASVFSHAREGITITDADGVILDINEAFTRITGYSRKEALGQNPRILNSGHHDKAFYEAMWRDLTGLGHWSGEVWNRRKDGEVYAELLTISAVCDAHGKTLQYVALFSDITGIKEHQNQLEHIAHFDALTSLPNRVLLADRLQQEMAQAQRRGQHLAVVYLDLDGFKAVNDRHGHDVGDQLLIMLTSAMKNTLREGDTLSRIGGDEFVAVLTDLQDPSSCAPLLTRLLEAAAAPQQQDDLVLQISASLGVTFYPQAQDIDADQLLRQADQAMYQAKLAGKNGYHVFDAAHDVSIRDQHESLQRIRQALTQREFVLHYQPKVNMRTGEVIGAEALIRWQHPDKGLLPPALFLPVIEDHPLAVEMGEWVIDTALVQMERWHGYGLGIPVSVNVGARQLQQADFVHRLKLILSKHPLVNPANLQIEVLETSALSDMAQVSQVIEDCAQIGVMFALDDFGTGYSSLTYLKRLRVALLKIDQSFVRDMLEDPDDLAILEGVIGLAAAFKRQVIAEGVESIEHGTALLHLGCELAQGYGIARPMPGGDMPAWIAAWRPDPAWCQA